MRCVIYTRISTEDQTAENQISQLKEYAERQTSREAAEYLRTSPFYLANLRHRCRGPAYHQIGSKILYSVQALDNWVLRSPRRKPRDLRDKKAV